MHKSYQWRRFLLWQNFNAAGDTTIYGGAWQYDWTNRLSNAKNGAVLQAYESDEHRVMMPAA
ncbi:MAG: hypothetical protein AB1813_13570 [Verrucomicrobiota bacterium]